MDLAVRGCTVCVVWYATSRVKELDYTLSKFLKSIKITRTELRSLGIKANNREHEQVVILR